MVRAKFTCNGITDLGYTKLVSMNAVYSSNGENADYAKATPCGNLSLNIDRDSKAADEFIVGKDYYIDFTPCI